MQQSINNDFNFHIPFDIEKGKDNSGKEVMKIKGLASTGNEDSQGEYLDPNGFDLDDFKWINYNHKGKDDPATIIGEPTKSQVKDNKFYIEGILYPEVPMAKATWNLMKALKKSPRGNKLSLSVEGKVMERDLVNPKIVKKARITGIAICPTPINSDTWVDFLTKGYTTDTTLEYDDVTLNLIKSEEGFWSLVEKDEKFKKYILENNKEKKEDVQEVSEDERLELYRAYTAEGNVHVSKESVEGTKNTENSYDDKKNMNKSEIILTKSCIYKRIFDQYSDIDIEKSKLVYKLAEKIKAMAEEKNITEETLKKAFSILELAKTDDKVEKAETEKEEDKDEKTVEKAVSFVKSNMEKMSKDEMIKSMIEKGYTKEVAEEGYKNANGGNVEVKKSETETVVEKSETNDDNISKSLGEIKDILQKSNTDVSKSFAALGEISKALVEDNVALKKSNEELQKSLSEHSEFIAEMKNRLQTIEKKPDTRKSVTDLKSVERFEKSENGNKKSYSLSNRSSRKQLVDYLAMESGINKGENYDVEIAKAAQDIEIGGGTLTPNAQAVCEKLDIIVTK